MAQIAPARCRARRERRLVDLQELNQKRIQGIILEYASKPQQKGSLGQKIGSLYNLMMDSVRLNKRLHPLKTPTNDNNINH